MDRVDLLNGVLIQPCQQPPVVAGPRSLHSLYDAPPCSVGSQPHFSRKTSSSGMVPLAESLITQSTKAGLSSVAEASSFKLSKHFAANALAPGVLSKPYLSRERWR